jgi:hypothetical protein
MGTYVQFFKKKEQDGCSVSDCAEHGIVKDVQSMHKAT